jgi:hypothetical protein
MSKLPKMQWGITHETQLRNRKNYPITHQGSFFGFSAVYHIQS